METATMINVRPMSAAEKLVGTVWDSSAGNRWAVVAAVDGERVRVQRVPQGDTHVWHIGSILDCPHNMKRVK